MRTEGKSYVYQHKKSRSAQAQDDFIEILQCVVFESVNWNVSFTQRKYNKLKGCEHSVEVKG